MSLFSRLTRRKPAIASSYEVELARYRNVPEPRLAGLLYAQRMVVVDVETSGLDPWRDRLLSIGAIVVSDGLVRLEQSFEVILRQDEASPEHNILVHGIGGSAQLAGREPAAALLAFLMFVRKDPLVAYRADFDRVAIQRATSAALNITPTNLWLDLALLAPALDTPNASSDTLDDWLSMYGIENYLRHDALADALSTAELFLALLGRAQAQALKTCADLDRLQKESRWLRERRLT